MDGIFGGIRNVDRDQSNFSEKKLYTSFIVTHDLVTKLVATKAA